MYHKDEQQVALCVKMGACHRVWNEDRFMLASKNSSFGGVCVCDTDVRSNECELVASRAPLTSAGPHVIVRAAFVFDEKDARRSGMRQ